MVVPESRKYFVLVVDDNRDAADSLAELVRLFGHEAVVAYDGETAVEKANKRRPDVLLCDIGLPGMSGYDVAKAIRATHERPVRMIAVSGYASADDVLKAGDSGFEAHVAKPPDPDRIERLLS